ncbi:helix-turn-helix domain-containing protein [Streptomyces sp. MK37H]|uniref:helix-turn-helix domain-containing protein n=1 Tax=Streptomyces sp. MK37H TaxID=2699117 RepID=UPI001B361D70|nr:helix-turn-helix domain-containing protein [Streptomyces sp. MK37H]MBP8535939.1 helix-turn-helix domain-containing protein [Streptomyces sp. MK37H]
MLEKTAAILDVIERGPASSAEIAEATGISRGTVFRLVRVMARLGLVAQDGGRVTLGPRIAQLAAAGDGVPVANAWAEKLVALRDATGAFAVRLHQLHSPATRVCIAEVLDLHAPQRSQLGMLEPLRADPVTLTFLTWQSNQPGVRVPAAVPYRDDTLTRTRRRGWAQGFSGPDHCVATVAAPVLDRRKRVVAVLEISGPVAALTPAPGRTHGRSLIAVASDSDVISECLYRKGAAVPGAPAHKVSSLHLLTTTRRTG